MVVQSSEPGIVITVMFDGTLESSLPLSMSFIRQYSTGSLKFSINL